MPHYFCGAVDHLLPGFGACWQRQFKGHTMMVNGNYNSCRLDDAWFDKQRPAGTHHSPAEAPTGQ